MRVVTNRKPWLPRPFLNMICIQICSHTADTELAQGVLGIGLSSLQKGYGSLA